MSKAAEGFMKRVIERFIGMSFMSVEIDNLYNLQCMHYKKDFLSKEK
ncbi:hypothetical protein [Lysinibacillus pakistanensis]